MVQLPEAVENQLFKSTYKLIQQLKELNTNFVMPSEDELKSIINRAKKKK
jgi:soluble P-type ATPase